MLVPKRRGDRAPAIVRDRHAVGPFDAGDFHVERSIAATLAGAGGMGSFSRPDRLEWSSCGRLVAGSCTPFQRYAGAASAGLAASSAEHAFVASNGSMIIPIIGIVPSTVDHLRHHFYILA